MILCPQDVRPDLWQLPSLIYAVLLDFRWWQGPDGLKLKRQRVCTCLSILLATSNCRARGTCGPSTPIYLVNGAGNA